MDNLIPVPSPEGGNTEVKEFANEKNVLAVSKFFSSPLEDGVRPSWRTRRRIEDEVRRWSTKLSFNLSEKQTVSLGVFDVIGKEVIGLSTPFELNAGSYSLPLNKNNLNPGVYFLKLNVDGYMVTRKVMVY